MGDKDFIKPVLERQSQVYFGKVRGSYFPTTALQSFHVLWQCAQLTTSL